MQKLTKDIVFIDNSDHNWRGDMDKYANLIDYISIANTSRNTESKYTNDLAKSGNQYAASILETGSTGLINNGLDKRVANKLKCWSNAKSSATKYALFDWDGTIVAAEGFSLDVFTPYQLGNNIKTIVKRRGGNTTKQSRSAAHTSSDRKRRTQKYVPKNKNEYSLQEMVDSSEFQETLTKPLYLPPKEFLDDMFAYLMRPNRVKMVRNLFQTLLKNGVKIHILTHNPYASTRTPYRKVFIEIFWRVLHQPRSSGTLDKSFEYSSYMESLISKTDIDAMLHSTVDYTQTGAQFRKRNIIESIGLV